MQLYHTGQKVKLSHNRLYFSEALKEKAKMQNGQEYAVFVGAQEGVIILQRLVAGEIPGE